MSKIILYGAGQLGRWTAKTLKKLGKPAFSFCDSNQKLWKKVICDLLCVPLAQVPRDATIVVTIYNGGEVRRVLRSFGFNVVSFAEFYRKELGGVEADVTLPYSVYDCRDLIDRSKMDIDKASRIWADGASLAEFNAQILYRQTLDDSYLSTPYPIEEQYFPPELSFQSQECFVDCGAFTGDSCEAFIRNRGSYGRNDSIIAIEPDKRNMGKLADYVLTQKGYDWLLYNCAVTSRPGHVVFNSTGDEAASISPSGATRVVADTLDRILAERVPTRIKLDIEGAEPFALAGAKKTLQRCKPDLAVCLYHCPEHLWTIPLWIKSVVPEYKLFLRRYAEECWELICYATVR